MTPNKTYIIAEAGVNHNGSLEMAKQLVGTAIAAKVDAVKFQIFRTKLIVSRFAGKGDYQKEITDSKIFRNSADKRLVHYMTCEARLIMHLI